MASTRVIKRDGSRARLDRARLASSIARAAASALGGPQEEAALLGEEIAESLARFLEAAAPEAGLETGEIASAVVRLASRERRSASLRVRAFQTAATTTAISSAAQTTRIVPRSGRARGRSAVPLSRGLTSAPSSARG